MARCPKCGTNRFAVEEVELEDNKGKLVVVMCAGCETAMSVVHPTFNYFPLLQQISTTLQEIKQKLK